MRIRRCRGWNFESSLRANRLQPARAGSLGDASTPRHWPRSDATSPASRRRRDCRWADRRASTPSYLHHQLPGGMVGTMRRHLAEHRVSHLEGAVIEELGRVRQELGWPIVMTPFSQIVLTQAVMNVTGAERYDVVPDELIRYALGRFGKPTVPIDPEVMDRIESLPRTRELRAEPHVAPLAGAATADRRAIFRTRNFCCARRCPLDRWMQCWRPGRPSRQYDPSVRPVMSLHPDPGGAPRPVERLAREGRLPARAAAGPNHQPRGRFDAPTLAGRARLQIVPPINGLVFDVDGTLLLSDRVARRLRGAAGRHRSAVGTHTSAQSRSSCSPTAAHIRLRSRRRDCGVSACRSKMRR